MTRMAGTSHCVAVSLMSASRLSGSSKYRVTMRGHTILPPPLASTGLKHTSTSWWKMAPRTPRSTTRPATSTLATNRMSLKLRTRIISRRSSSLAARRAATSICLSLSPRLTSVLSLVLRALELVAEGKSYDEIAHAVGYTHEAPPTGPSSRCWTSEKLRVLRVSAASKLPDLMPFSSLCGSGLWVVTLLQTTLFSGSSTRGLAYSGWRPLTREAIRSGSLRQARWIRPASATGHLPPSRPEQPGFVRTSVGLARLQVLILCWRRDEYDERVDSVVVWVGSVSVIAHRGARLRVSREILNLPDGGSGFQGVL